LICPKRAVTTRASSLDYFRPINWVESQLNHHSSNSPHAHKEFRVVFRSPQNWQEILAYQSYVRQNLPITSRTRIQDIASSRPLLPSAQWCGPQLQPTTSSRRNCAPLLHVAAPYGNPSLPSLFHGLSRPFPRLQNFSRTLIFAIRGLCHRCCWAQHNQMGCLVLRLVIEVL